MRVKWELGQLVSKDKIEPSPTVPSYSAADVGFPVNPPLQGQHLLLLHAPSACVSFRSLGCVCVFACLLVFFLYLQFLIVPLDV